MIIDVITGDDYNGGERPNNFGESLYIKCVTGGNGSATKLANSGKDGGYTFPDVDANAQWTTKTVNIPASNRGLFLWQIYAAAGSPEFQGQGGVYANNQNAGDRFAVSRIRIYGEVPTNLAYFRGNDQYPNVPIFPGDPVTFSWNTKLGNFTTCTSGTIYRIGGGGGENAIHNIGGGSIDVGSWTLASGPTEETTYRIRVQGNSGPAELDVTVTMLAPDDDPDLVGFNSVDEATPGQMYESNTITISGLGTTVSVSASNGAQVRVNGGGWSNSVNVSNGDTLQVRMTASGAFQTQKTTTVSIGSAQSVWKITTGSEPPQIPNTFAFTNVTDAETNTLVQSNTVTITGISQSLVVSVPSNGDFESRVGSGSWSSAAKTVSNGQTLQLRVTTSGVLGDTKSTTITVGASAPVGWSVQNKSTADSNPDYFDFTDTTNSAANTLIVSNPQTITGINVQTNVSTTNGAQIQKNGGNWVASPTTINNGDTVRVRILSSADPGGSVSTEVSIGNTPTSTLTDTWTVNTTTSGDIIPDPFFFIDKTEQVPGSFVESNMVLIQGITSPSPLSVSGGQASINGGPWVQSGVVNNGDTLKVRIVASISVSTATSLSITIG